MIHLMMLTLWKNGTMDSMGAKHKGRAGVRKRLTLNN